MASDSRWTTETSIALVLFYAIVGALVFWAFGWSGLKILATGSARGFGIGLVAWAASLAIVAIIATLLVLVSRMFTLLWAKRSKSHLQDSLHK